MKRLTRLTVCTILALYAGILAHAGSIAGIVVYYYPHNDFQSSLVAELNKQLNNKAPETPVRFIADYNLSVIQANDMIISIGHHEKIDATLDAMNNDVIYINNTAQQSTDSLSGKKYTNVEINQPACRYLRLAHMINQQWHQIGYLQSSPDDARLAQLKACAKQLNLRINAVSIESNDDLAKSIDKVLQRSDVLLAMPDSKIYNRHSVKNILLTAYRLKIPVIGFSDNFVNAGALAAVYSTPEQIAQQLISIISNHTTTEISTAVNRHYPGNFSIKINKQVANSLNLSIPEEDHIKASLQKLEGVQ